MVAILLPEVVQAYRSRTFRTAPGLRIHDVEAAIQFVNERAFTFFWPINGITLPSLWTAVAGDRPVADAHDDPGHVTWGWKDSLLGQRRWYYGKVLRKKSTMISLEAAPYFYALSENYGSPEEDYLTLYEQGRLTLEAKAVYEALLDRGPLDTVALRKEAHLSSRESDGRFNKAITDLQTDFKVLPVGVSQAGGWNYCFIYDIPARHFPELLDQAQNIRETAAYEKLTEWYFRAVGAAKVSDVVKLFGWRAPAAERAVNALVEAGGLCRSLELQGQRGEWVAVKEMVAEA